MGVEVFPRGDYAGLVGALLVIDDPYSGGGLDGERKLR